MRKIVLALALAVLGTVAFAGASRADSADATVTTEPRVPMLTLALAGGLPLLVLAGLGSLLIARRAVRPQAASITQVPMAAPVSRRQITEIRGPQASLDELSEDGLSHRLDGTMIRIGRHQENDIRLASQTVHRYHAVLHVTPRQGYVLTDLSGPEGNGVLVNEIRAEQAELTSGDVIELGEVKLRFRVSDTN